MQIKSITIGILKIPLIRPFITAIRRTDHVEDVIVQIKTDTGAIGYGSAAATPAITGETQASIISAIQNILAPKLIGKRIDQFNELLNSLEIGLQKNSSAKAAMDIALHDLFAQYCQLPLYKFLGGAVNKIKSCVTISLKEPDEMATDAQQLYQQGFEFLKLKVGGNPQQDIERIKAIRSAIGNKAKIIVDANQGWQTKSAIQTIQTIEHLNLEVEIIEQPLPAHDLKNLKFVRTRVNSFIMADESCFSPEDAMTLAKMEACDGINIKLMKSGGIAKAQAIYQIAKSSQIPCMVGCMLESPIGIAAMASFRVSKSDILLADLDPIILIKQNPIQGGAKLMGNEIILADQPGLGISELGEGYQPIAEVKE